jgi:hypothetical protein
MFFNCSVRLELPRPCKMRHYCPSSESNRGWISIFSNTKTNRITWSQSVTMHIKPLSQMFRSTLYYRIHFVFLSMNMPHFCSHLSLSCLKLLNEKYLAWNFCILWAQGHAFKYQRFCTLWEQYNLDQLHSTESFLRGDGIQLIRKSPILMEPEASSLPL